MAEWNGSNLKVTDWKLSESSSGYDRVDSLSIGARGSTSLKPSPLRWLPNTSKYYFKKQEEFAKYICSKALAIMIAYFAIFKFCIGLAYLTKDYNGWNLLAIKISLYAPIFFFVMAIVFALLVLKPCPFTISHGKIISNETKLNISLILFMMGLFSLLLIIAVYINKGY